MKTFEEYKNFNNIIQIIFKKSPLQKKKILNFISKQNNDYFVKAENFSKNYSCHILCTPPGLLFPPSLFAQNMLQKKKFRGGVSYVFTLGFF